MNAANRITGFFRQGMKPMHLDLDGNRHRPIKRRCAKLDRVVKNRFNLLITVAIGVAAPHDIATGVKAVGLRNLERLGHSHIKACKAKGRGRSRHFRRCMVKRRVTRCRINRRTGRQAKPNHHHQCCQTKLFHRKSPWSITFAPFRIPAQTAPEMWRDLDKLRAFTRNCPDLLIS